MPREPFCEPEALGLVTSKLKPRPRRLYHIISAKI